MTADPPGRGRLRRLPGRCERPLCCCQAPTAPFDSDDLSGDVEKREESLYFVSHCVGWGGVGWKTHGENVLASEPSVCSLTDSSSLYRPIFSGLLILLISLIRG